MTECITQLAFDFYKKSSLRVDFSGGDITSDAGVLLLGQADKRLGLLEGLAGCIQDWRDENLVKHTLEEQLRQRVYQIGCGYEDANDSDSLRGDPALKIACGRLPNGERDLASQPTMSRLENRVSQSELAGIRRYFVERFIESYQQAPEQLVLDIDGWDDPTHGAQQLTFFHGFYEQHMYYPVQISEAKSGRPLVVQLRAGNSHAGKGVKGVLAWLLWRLRKAWPEVKITVRGDCGFSLPEILRVCERLRVHYVFGLTTNEVLKRAIEPLLQQASQQWLETGQKARLFGETGYAAHSWRHARRVITKAERLEKGLNRRFLVTNRTEAPQWIYDTLYVQRGEDCENRIKEFKAGLSADRLSCHRFDANQFRLYLTQAAYWLLLEIRQAAQGTELEKAQVPRLRERLLKLGAQVIQSVRRVWVQLAFSCPSKDILKIITQRLTQPQQLGT